MAHRVFVYGTLLAGEHNHHRLKDSPRVEEALTLPEFDFRCLGYFPALLRPGKTAVKGEVYEVSDEVLADLDRLEGHPYFYRRVTIKLADNAEPAYTYVLHDTAWRMDTIPSGDWRQYARERNL